MRILAHLLASVALTILYFYVFIAMRAFLGLGAWSVLADTLFLPTAFREGFLWSWVVYWVIFGAQQTFRYYQHYLASEVRLEQMERSFSEARLNALRMQLAGKELLYRSALNELASHLGPTRFIRVHRSSIVNIDSILELQPISHGEFALILRDGHRSRVSRTHRIQLEKRLGQSL
jgi:hypothetical protein